MYDFSILLCAAIGKHPKNSSRRIHKFKFGNFEQEPQLLYEWPRSFYRGLEWSVEKIDEAKKTIGADL